VTQSINFTATNTPVDGTTIVTSASVSTDLLALITDYNLLVGNNKLDSNAVTDSVVSATANIKTTKIDTTTAWLAQSLAWTGTSSNPAIGNGTLAASYFKIGRLVLCWITMTMGSTTTFGSGEWRWALPVTAASNSNYMCGSWTAFQNSSGKLFTGTSITYTTLLGALDYSNSTTRVGAGTPFTFAANDSLNIMFIYESAS